MFLKKLSCTRVSVSNSGVYVMTYFAAPLTITREQRHDACIEKGREREREKERNDGVFTPPNADVSALGHLPRPILLGFRLDNSETMPDLISSSVS